MTRAGLIAGGGRHQVGRADPDLTPLDLALRANRAAFLHLFGIGSAITALGFATSIYMLEVFDRVMSTRSSSTLLGLAFAFLLGSCAYVALVSLRAAVLRRVGLAMDAATSGPAYDAVYAAVLETRRLDRLGAIQDLDTVRRFWSSSSLTALLDLPWFPVYVIVCFAFHVVLGIGMLVGIVGVVLLALVNEFGNRTALRYATESASAERETLSEALREAEIVSALGMVQHFRSRWSKQARTAMGWTAAAAAYAHNVGYVGTFWQNFVQFGMVAVAAYLSILGQVSGGAMFAVMFIGAGGIAVVRAAVTYLPSFIAARQAHRRLQALFRSAPVRDIRLTLSRPKGELDVAGLAMSAPGEPRLILSQVAFRVPAGTTVAVIGPSGAGKSTLVRALVGLWAPSLGTVRLDGAEIQHWDPDLLGRHIGYLPQDVDLLSGTIGENIARFGPVDGDAIGAAAELTGVHDLIGSFPRGYETKVGDGGRSLSGGQRQRIGLARAVYGDPAFVVLDEPNANLDMLGEGALADTVRALKARSTTCIIITHKANILTLADYILVLKDGTVSRYGPRDEIMPQAPRVVSAGRRRAAEG